MIAMGMVNYWKDVEETASTIADEFPVVVSKDHRMKGTKGGMLFEVSRFDAAKLIVAGTHELANGEAVDAWRKDLAQRREVAQREETARRLQLSVIERGLMGLGNNQPQPASPPKK
ncbi:MAG: hypothetical protein EPO02_13080 [Nitrospirae bacterium]|nr:MAG: hypothetical protein EPO02_13080 [Nitrospirota bacterium]